MAQNTKSKKRRKKAKKRRSKQRSQALTMVLAIAFLLILAVFLLRIMLRQQTPPEDTSTVSAESVTEQPQMPANTLMETCFGEENGYKTYQSGTVTAKLGLDVSSHQGWIDWGAVADGPADFVILRAGYRGYSDGSINPDSYWEYNISSATATDLGVGVYFFSQALSPEEAAAEAYTVLSMIEGYDIDYPIYFDWEPVSSDQARTANISASEVTACALEFCQTIEAAGYRAGVYFNPSIAGNYYNLYDLKDYEFWLAQYTTTPDFPFAFGIWQYTAEGSLSGISTNVDMNLSFTTYGN